LVRRAGYLTCAVLLAVSATALAAYQAEDHRVVPRTREVTIVCPKLLPTRVILPERVTGYRGDPAAELALGFQIQTRPQPVITLRPREHPVEARFRIEGATRPLVLVFRTAPNGESRDVRLTFGSAPAPDARSGPASAASGAQSTRRSPATVLEPKPTYVEPTPVPAPRSTSLEDGGAQPAAASAVRTEAPVDAQATPQPAPNGVLEAAAVADVVAPRTPAPLDGLAASSALLDPGILTARVRSVGRIERLPGQRPVELVDVLEASRHVWLRFSIGEARGARLEGISWEHGRITAYAVEQVEKGSRLTLVVQLPRRSETGVSLITKRTRIHLKLDDGERRFPLSAPWLGSVVKDLFGW
jgi:hypothetical protein